MKPESFLFGIPDIKFAAAGYVQIFRRNLPFRFLYDEVQQLHQDILN